MRCTVFGTGYLGATHAAGMAELGHDVVGVDIDAGKVAKLASGDIPFYEPGLRKMLSDNLAAGRLRFTTDYDEAADFADVHFLGVGTPQKKGEYGADLRHVHAVIDSLVPRLTPTRGDRRQVNGARRYGRRVVGTGPRARPRGRRRRGGMESGIPARGLRRIRHPASRPHCAWRATGFGRAPRRRSGNSMPRCLSRMCRS